MKKQLNLKNLIYLIVFFLPVYLIRFNFLGVPTNALEILILTMFLIWVLEKKNWPDIKEKFLSYGGYIIFTGLIFMGLIISVLANGNYRIDLGVIKGWFFISILFLIVASSILGQDKIKNVFKTLYFSAFFTSSMALIYLFLGQLTYDGRLEAFFNSPNYLAMYLAPGVIIGAINRKILKLKSNLFLFSLAVILIAFWETFSYAAWIAAASSIILVFIFKKEFYFKKISLVGLLVVLFILQLNTVKFNNLFNLNRRSSLASRVMIWKASEKILRDNWVLGIGPGNFQEKYLEYQKYFPPYLEWAVPHPHNLYLAFWLYSGVIGLIGFLGLVFLWFKEAFKKRRKDELIYLAFGIMFYILIHGLVDTTYFKNDLAVIFWLNFLVLKIR